MTVVAITCAGRGDAWLFETRTGAFLHPLVQYGDAILAGPEDVRAQYNWLEWPELARRAGVSLTGSPRTHREQQFLMSVSAARVWEGLVATAQRPPTSAKKICDMVSHDRRHGASKTVAKHKHKHEEPEATQTDLEDFTGETDTFAATEVPRDEVVEDTEDLAPTPLSAPLKPASKRGSAKKEEGAEPKKAHKGPRGMDDNSTIALGVDKEGRSYGPENNPKKPGSKTHGRFVLYTSGMTVAQAIEAGITSADIDYDVKKGFIVVTAPAKLAEAA